MFVEETPLKCDKKSDYLWHLSCAYGKSPLSPDLSNKGSGSSPGRLDVILNQRGGVSSKYVSLEVPLLPKFFLI